MVSFTFLSSPGSGPGPDDVVWKTVSYSYCSSPVFMTTLFFQEKDRYSPK